ncbi:HD domain-containing phosphohydrolase [Paenibacillus sp.]|uniref:HD domain-containing phosphohydrolase n=1 Tax=Paenibacillus sp. TaxID=58172 RepID=UPI002D4125E2|nr:HD domain-containing phosphohydrolase [Paenibacillus sp.]HZG88339.1 HD domain-containing phosphohydrolase [Paenibacillus sp.]
MPKLLQVYIYTVFALGMTGLVLIIPGIEQRHLLEIAALAALAGLLEIYMVELPNGTVFGGGSIITFGVLFSYGVPEALAVEVITALVISILVHKVELKHVLFNVGQYTISLAAASLVLVRLEGVEGEFGWHEIPVGLAVISTYFVVSLGLLFIILATLKKKNYFAVWRDSFKDILISYTVTIIFSFRLAMIYDQSNQTQFWVETIFLFVFFFALRHAFGMFIRLRKTYLRSLESLMHLNEDKLSTGAGHATRTGRLARQIAERLKLPQEEVDAIHYAALLHDIGKGQINSKIFQKKGPMTLEEEKEYRKHPEFGAEMIKDISGLAKAAEYIRYHHERWDGGGFPEGKKNEDIPLGARIIAAANEYDHIVYGKKGGDPAVLYQALSSNVLDPKLVDIVRTIADFLPAPESEYLESAIQEKRLLENVMMTQARTKFYESALLEKFGAAVIATYDGTYRDGQGTIASMPCQSQVDLLVRRASEQQIRIREYVEDPVSGKVYDIYCVPAGEQVHLMVFDVSNILEYEKVQEERIKKLYQDVIFSVTHGKLLLAEEAELESYYGVKLLGEAPIRSKSDIAKCRALVQSILDELPYEVPQKTKYDILLSTSETATNVLKHATEGQLSVYIDKHMLRIIVKDGGSGIDLSELPKTTLMAGYSTKLSMGHGFSLLLKLNDRIVLNTGPKGTTVVLEIGLSAVTRKGEATEANSPLQGRLVL